MQKKTSRKVAAPEDIWEQMPGENIEQYMKFSAYRDMAYQPRTEAKDVNCPSAFQRKKRSLRTLAKELHLSSVRPLEILSVKFNWTARCEAYDLDIDRRARQAQEEAVIKMREDHALLAAQMIRKATKRLLTIPEDEISASDIVRLADVGVKIERLSRGESTENQNVRGEIEYSGAVKVEHAPLLDLSSLTDEELGDLEHLIVKIVPQAND